MLDSLERQRAYLAWKCGGLDAAGMRATLGSSTVTLGGLLKHLAFMEDTNFSWPGRGWTVVPWNSGDSNADPDWEWHSAAENSPEELMALWRAAVARSRAVVAAALAEGGLDHQARFVLPDGRSPSLRRQMIDRIEEYARHVGQADPIRESGDGLVGEDTRDARDGERRARADHAAAVPRDRRARRVAVRGRGSLDALPHRVVRGRRTARPGDG